jgi:signal transduction histidine kinase/HAMP domain-containing protein
MTSRTLRQRAVAWRYDWTGRHVPLAFKFAVPVVLTTAVLAVIIVVFVTDQVNRHIQAAYERQADSIAAGVEVIFAQHPNDIAYIDDYLRRLLESQPDLVSIRIHGLDSGATVIASARPQEVGSSGLVEPDELRAVWQGYPYQDEDDGDILTTVRPLKEVDLLFGAVIIRSSKGPAAAAARSVATSLGLAALVGIALESIFVLWAIYFGILRRTRRMQRAVESVARGDTSVRLAEGTLAPGRDEIFNLMRSVAHMILSLDERQRGEALVRRVARQALQGSPAEFLITFGLTEAREALALETCMFARVDEGGTLASWLDGSSSRHPGGTLPVWVAALTHVAVEARKVVVSDRLGREGRFAEEQSSSAPSQAAVIPLPRSSKAGEAIVAIAPLGQAIPDGGIAVLDAIAATVADSLHMQAAENARAESDVKSKVMSAVSHEMRNPLNSILGFTSLLMSDQKESLSDKQRRQLGYVHASATNMLTLVNNYLDLARVRTGSLALQYETTRIEPLVADVFEAMQPDVEAKKITIRSSITAGLEARVDPTRVRQVLNNLLSNAVRFTASGGRVVVRARSDGNRIRLAVSDSGVGIPKHQKSLIFTEFAKIDAGAMASSKGTGLGLALTRAFVTAMGGTIRFYSRPGRGTTMVVVLPRDGGVAKRASAA